MHAVKTTKQSTCQLPCLQYFRLNRLNHSLNQIQLVLYTFMSHAVMYRHSAIFS